MVGNRRSVVVVKLGLSGGVVSSKVGAEILEEINLINTLCDVDEHLNWIAKRCSACSCKLV